MDLAKPRYCSLKPKWHPSNGFLVSDETSSHFGEHFMIDGYNCSQKKLNDREVVLSCLIQLPRKLGMNPLSCPEVHFAKGGTPKDPGGWTGIVVIEESHISIHTFPQLRFVTIDVYTCKNGLRIAAIQSFFKRMLEIKIFETNFVKRGQKFSTLALGYSDILKSEERNTNHDIRQTK